MSWSGREDLNLRPPGPETKNFELSDVFSIHVSGASTVQTHIIPARRSHSFSYGCPGVGAPNQGIRSGGSRWVSNVSDRPLVYESRGKLQIQTLCGADDIPRHRMNTVCHQCGDPCLTRRKLDYDLATTPHSATFPEARFWTARTKR